MALRSRDIEVNIEELGDIDVARRAAAGDADAFAVLYRRYASAAWRVAQAVAASSDDAADAVSEAFTNMLQALATGKLNPEVPFPPYLLVATRNAAIDQHRKHARLQPLPPDPIEPATTASGPAETADERADVGLVAEAFRALPERWRSVLWLTEVEGIPARDVGVRMGLTPNGAAQLAHRARTGLRERFLQAHLRHQPRRECVETVSLLGAYASRSLPARATAKVDAHLADCAECRARVEELTDIGGTLRAIALPLPLFLAPAALAHYKAAFGIATHARAAGSLWAVGTAAGERVTRALAVSTSALLALGVISAGLMSGGGGPSPVPGSPSGGAVEAAPQATVTQLPATGSTLIDNAAAVGAHGGFVNESPRVPAATVTQLAAPPPPSGPQSTGTPRTTGPPAQTPAPPAAAGPVLGVRLGANLGIATAGVSVGLGGSCSGLALNSSKPCAGTAPTGVLGLSVTTPLGTLSL